MTETQSNSQLLLEQQEQLHEESQRVLDELALLPELQKYGEPFIVGSFALELLTRRDIDIKVVVDSLDKRYARSCALI